MAYSKTNPRNQYEPEGRVLIPYPSQTSRIDGCFDSSGKRYIVKRENALYKARVKKKTYLDI